VPRLTAEALDHIRRFDTCAIANAIELFEQRLRNEGSTDASIHCLFPDLPTVVGYATTARVRSASPPPVGHSYHDRTDWWTHILSIPAPRIVVVQDMDGAPGLGAFVGEVHVEILRALGCTAYVTNGGVRDLPAVRRIGARALRAGLHAIDRRIGVCRHAARGPHRRGGKGRTGFGR
jgi:regulator of RNase E activity RraA